MKRTNNLHKDYVSYSVSAIDGTQELRRGRPNGGLSILWHKSLSKHIQIVDTKDPRVIELTYKNN